MLFYENCSSYLKSVLTEAKKVSWTPKNEVFSYSAFVVFIVALFSFFILIFDSLCIKILYFILG